MGALAVGSDAVRAAASGFLISLGCKICLNTGGFLGALLFSIALCCIVQYGLPLFTGKVGYRVSVKTLMFILLCNLIGAMAGGLLLEAYIPAEKAALRFVPSWALFIKGVGCGALMFLAVDLGKKCPWLTIMCVMAFILSGFEHCIADMAYMSNNAIEHLDALFVIILGNAAGAKLTRELIVTIQRPENDGKRNKETVKVVSADPEDQCGSACGTPG